jgi:hypothetical protein
MNAEVGKKYRHYKGNEYEVLYIGKHTETEEELVIYRAVKDPEKIWARPRAMFEEEVEVEGKMLLRFTPIE